MRILVTFAVDAEFAPWRKLRPFRNASAAGTAYFTSQAGNAAIDVVLTGMGGKKPWVGLLNEIYESDIDLCVSTGLAGALRAEHRLGNILVARKVLAPSRDMTALSEDSMVDAAIGLGAKSVEHFYTAERVITSAAEKRKLGAIADAVEMESFGVLMEAGMFAEKSVAIRAISDEVDEELPLDFNGVTTGDGQVSIGKVLGKVAGSPGSIPSLIRFGKRSRQSAELLAEFLEKFVSRVVATATTESSHEEMAG
jgi:adenosylhomocysteine nucleosidase